MRQADIGLIGLAVMGENLVMNMESKGFAVAVTNRTVDKVKNFIEGRACGKNIVGCYSLQELVAALEPPRRVMMMVKAGSAVDALIEQLYPDPEATEETPESEAADPADAAAPESEAATDDEL